jgi:hypothetical protein
LFVACSSGSGLERRTDPPSHRTPASAIAPVPHPESGPATRRSRRAAAIWIIAIAVLLGMLILHLTGAFGPAPTVSAMFLRPGPQLVGTRA